MTKWKLQETQTNRNRNGSNYTTLLSLDHVILLCSSQPSQKYIHSYTSVHITMNRFPNIKQVQTI